jgi:hypothetical protein
MKKPKTLTYKFEVAPDQGFAAMATALIPPKGYVFHSMERKNTKAKVIFVQKEDKN